MKLFLLFHGRFPSEKAASLFAAKSAEAFAASGCEVTLVVPRRRGAPEGNPYAFYGVKDSFELKYLPTLDLYGALPHKLAFWLSFVAFSAASFFYLRSRSGRGDIIYSNESLPLFLASFVRPNTLYEMHDFPESKLGLFGVFLARMRSILIHNRWKLDETKRRYPQIEADRFLYEPNAVDTGAFDLGLSKEDARRRLSLPVSAKIAVYTGHLYGWKGVDTLAAAAAFLAPSHLIVFVGGTERDAADFKARHGGEDRIRVIGFRPHTEIPVWQAAADVLVLPNTAKEKISAFYTSPMKLFEYMASRRPIVASDIPSITEIIDTKCASIVPPDDAKALAAKIEDVFANDRADLAEAAFQRIAEHTWDKRAQRILSFIRR